MPLVVDQLQIWTIGFKWAGFDPAGLWPRIPETVRDNFSTLLEAVLSEHLDCSTLSSEKYAGDDRQIASMHIRFWLDDVYAAVHGQYFSRKLLKHAVIERQAFQDWCERRTVPLPEFWFPPGWTDYQWPEYDPRSELNEEPPKPALVGVENFHSQASQQTPDEPAPIEPPPKELRDNQIARIASQQVARVIWKEDAEKTIAAMCKDDRVLKYGGAQYYAEEVVRRWLKEVAPEEVSAKRGRPKKQNSTEVK